MALTRSQKIYGLVMIASVGAFVWDRYSTGPSSAEAHPAGELLVSHDGAGRSGESYGSELKKENDPAAFRSGVNQRLSRVSRAECLDLNSPANAFELPDAWRPLEASEPVHVSSATSDSAHRIADAFGKRKLEAVVVGKRGYANVEGQGIFIGDSMDGCTLLSVTRTSAVFGVENLRVVLRLNLDSTVNRKGSLIENTSPHRR